MKVLKDILEIRNGITFQGIVRRPILWNQHAFLTIELNRPNIYLYRHALLTEPIHRYLNIMELEVSTKGTILTLVTNKHKYQFDVYCYEKASQLLRLLKICKQYHHSKPLFRRDNQNGGSKLCTICCYNRSHLIKLLPCGHQICIYCYLSWKDDCPFCRSRIKSLENTVETFREFMNLIGGDG
jgi:hypothetical protein